MKRPRQVSAANDEVAMTTMIDVVFLLLVFFVWTSSFDAPEHDLPSHLALLRDEQPESSGTETQVPSAVQLNSTDELVLRVEKRDGVLSYRIGNVEVNGLDAVKSRLKQIATLGIDPPVIIDPDDNVTMEIAISAFDLARESGLRRVYFAIDDLSPDRIPTRTDAAKPTDAP